MSKEEYKFEQAFDASFLFFCAPVLQTHLGVLMFDSHVMS